MRFAKINVRVRDIDAATAYVRDILGGEIVRPAHEMPVGVAAIVQMHGLVFEIVQPAPGTAMAAALDRRGEGIDSVGFVSADVLGDAASLESRGALMVLPQEDGLTNTAWVHPRNPLSTSIELFSSSSSELFND